MNPDGDKLPPPPPVIPASVKPIKVEQGVPVKLEHVRSPPPALPPARERRPPRNQMGRPGLGKKGQPIQLMSNHFRVEMRKTDSHFYHYSVAIKYEDGKPVDGKGIGRKVIDRLHQTYASELGNKDTAYDGEKSLFTIGALPQNINEFTVVLEETAASRKSPGNGSPNANESPNENDRKRLRRVSYAKTYSVELTFAAKIPMQAIAMALRGQESENSQEALRVLDIILRQNAAKQGCLLVRQSFFRDSRALYVDLGGGVGGLRGFHSSFRTSQGSVQGGGSLSLNMDVSTTMIVKPGPLVDFLIANQGVRDPFSIDWVKAKKMLKNLRVSTRPSNQEFKIVGLSDDNADRQLFTLKKRNAKDGNEDSDFYTEEITVCDYFKSHKSIELSYSARLPCVNVGKPKRPTYVPIELCSLVPLQRYTKSLTTLQRSSLVEKSRQKPHERMAVLSEALRQNNYDADPMLRALGITISKDFTKVDGRVLQAPKLRVGNGEDFFPRNGRWNFNNKKLMNPTKIEKWGIVNFSARCQMQFLVRDLLKCGNLKGIQMDEPYAVIEENRSMCRAPAGHRVENMFGEIKTRFPGAPYFLLALLPERKNSDIYGPWKRKCLAEFGIFTQCIAPSKVNDQYLTNVLLKINAKLGGTNSILQVEHSKGMPLISRAPTIILGMDVSHGSPGQSDVPSIAAVVSSREWPLITKYRASVRTQSPKVEMIDSLFKPVDKEDKGIIRELLLDFYTSSGNRKPDQIIIFRDGVSESQFNQVLNIELNQIIEACKFLDEQWCPKFTLIVAQKNHHTKFFQRSPDNVPPGTVVDNAVCHPRNYDFYMCAQAGMIGTTRPTHYHVLLDEIGFSPDDLQELVHSLSYVYQRSTTAISVVAPICYAHLAASQMGQFIKFEDRSESSSGHGGVTAAGSVHVPELPRLNIKVSSSMFFC